MSGRPKPYIITIVGPESSGKTTLASRLAENIGCPWVPEYAREYIANLDRPYQKEDLEAIAREQLELNRAFVQKELPLITALEKIDLKDDSILTFQLEEFGHEARPLLIVDSGMLSLRIWAAIKYDDTLPIVEKALLEDMTSMYLLCRPVYPWAEDPLREAPGLLDRVWIYNKYLNELGAMALRQSNPAYP